MSKRTKRVKPFNEMLPSEIVAAFIRFDNYQQPIHSWHCLQDCLETLRKWEREYDTAEMLLAAARKGASRG